ncbi:MAG: aromatic amino acid ammonia-lyase [Candidatus Doudnabacteria bacterium]
MKTINIDGKSLDLDSILSVLNDPGTKVNISASTLKKIQKSADFLGKEIINSKVIYGINTGFGPMASHLMARDQIVQLQENLIRSHAVGVGDPMPEKFVLAAMIIRLNTLAEGYSGASQELIQQLKIFINKRIIPVILEHGGVGASGDLVQLAHIALALIGEGKVNYQGKTRPTSDVLKQLKIKPYQLRPKEGLSLINGTSFMSGIGSVICHDSDMLLNLAIKTGAWSLELVNGYTDGFSEKLHSLRPHKGQVAVARKLRELLASSKLLKSRELINKQVNLGSDVKEIPEFVQEVYSIRCIPQILGPIYDTLQKTKQVIETEINSVTDNPIVYVDKKTFLHGGNFHGDYISSSLDQLKMTLVRLTMLSERRVNFFLNHNVNRFLPPFINLNKIGLNLGLQALQFPATSTTAKSQTLAYPQYVHSIPTNADNQDIVSMGTDSALITTQVVDNAFVVLAIELVTLAQAVDYLKYQNKLSKSSNELYKAVRRILPKVVEDRMIGYDLTMLVSEVKKGVIK